MDKFFDTSYISISEINEGNNELESVFNEDEEVTTKIPNPELKENCRHGNNEIINNYKIILLQCKDSYNEYYGGKVYGIILKSETQDFWFGIPLQNQNLGMVTWSKEVWNKIYSFHLQFNMRPEF